VVRLTKAGLYKEDPYAERYYRNNVRAQWEQGHRLAPDLEMALTCDEHITELIESSQLLSQRYAEIKPIYVAWLDELRDASPLNITHQLKGELNEVKKLLADRENELAQMRQEMAEMRRLMGLPPRSQKADEAGLEASPSATSGGPASSQSGAEPTAAQREPVKLASDRRTAEVKRLTSEGKVEWLENGPEGEGRYWVGEGECPEHLLETKDDDSVVEPSEPTPGAEPLQPSSAAIPSGVPEGPPGQPTDGAKTQPKPETAPPSTAEASGPTDKPEHAGNPASTLIYGSNPHFAYVANGWKAIPGHAPFRKAEELVYLSMEVAEENGIPKQGVFWVGNGPCPPSLLPPPAEPPSKAKDTQSAGTASGAAPASTQNNGPATGATNLPASTAGMNKSNDSGTTAAASVMPMVTPLGASSTGSHGQTAQPESMEIPPPQSARPSASMAEVQAVVLFEGRPPVVILDVKFAEKEKVKKLAPGRIRWFREDGTWYFNGPTEEFPPSLLPYLRIPIPDKYLKPAAPAEQPADNEHASGSKPTRASPDRGEDTDSAQSFEALNARIVATLRKFMGDKPTEDLTPRKWPSLQSAPAPAANPNTPAVFLNAEVDPEVAIRDLEIPGGTLVFKKCERGTL